MWEWLNLVTIYNDMYTFKHKLITNQKSYYFGVSGSGRYYVKQIIIQ